MGRNMLTENGFEHYFLNALPEGVRRITDGWDYDEQARFAEFFHKNAHLTDEQFGVELSTTAEVAAALRSFGWEPMAGRR